MSSTRSRGSWIVRWAGAVTRIKVTRRATDCVIHPLQRILDREVGGGCYQDRRNEEGDRKRHLQQRIMDREVGGGRYQDRRNEEGDRKRHLQQRIMDLEVGGGSA